MKYIDDLEEVMHITGETNYDELQKEIDRIIKIIKEYLG